MNNHNLSDKKYCRFITHIIKRRIPKFMENPPRKNRLVKSLHTYKRLVVKSREFYSCLTRKVGKHSISTRESSSLEFYTKRALPVNDKLYRGNIMQYQAYHRAPVDSPQLPVGTQSRKPYLQVGVTCSTWKNQIIKNWKMQ